VALQFNVGELTARLRRALGTRGKSNFGLDETVVPVVLVGDAQQAPYREDERRWFVRVVVNPVAAQFGRCSLNNPTNQDMVLDWATNTSPSTDVNWGTGAGALGVLPCFSTEGITRQQIAAGTYSTPRGPNHLENNGAASIIVNLMGVLPGAAAAGVVGKQVRLDLVIPAGGTVIFETAVVNVGVILTFSGRTFDNAGR